MKILIQLEGFTVSAAFRTYTFRVIDAPGETRQFRVQVPLESFRVTPLKVQDGPLISCERLQQELDREKQGSHAATHLGVGESDILVYLERHYPPKAREWTQEARASFGLTRGLASGKVALPEGS